MPTRRLARLALARQQSFFDIFLRVSAATRSQFHEPEWRRTGAPHPHLDPESISEAKSSQLSSLEMMFPVPRRPVFPINLKVVWKGRRRLAVALAVELKAVCHGPGVVK